MQVKIPDFSVLEAQIKQKSALFEHFYQLLTEYNQKFNLTAITERSEVFHKHFLDSVAGAHLLPDRCRVAEIGSGAGFPSIPIKLLRDDLSFLLVESTGKKCTFLRTAVRELGLDGVEIVNARAEDLGRDPTFREQFDAAIARAVAPLSSLAEYCMPFVRVGGRFVAWKGSEDELAGGKRAVRVLGGGESCAVGYELPESFGKRTLIVTEKIRSTPAQYPRGNGKERKQPL